MTDDPARQGDAGAQGSVPVERPPAGEDAVIATTAGQVYELRFPPQAAAVRVLDADGDGRDDLVLAFEAGTERESRVLFLDMARLAAGPGAPQLQVGGELFNADFVVQQALALAGEQPTLRTAAAQGPEAAGTGATRYSDDFGQAIGLLDPQGVIPPTALAFPTIDPEGDAADEDPAGTILGQAGQDDTDSDQSGSDGSGSDGSGDGSGSDGSGGNGSGGDGSGGDDSSGDGSDGGGSDGGGSDGGDDAGVPGVLVVGSNEDDGDDQQTPHTVANPEGDDSGPVRGGDDDDVLVGDPGGVLLAGRFNVAVAVDVTASIGPENIETLNEAVENLVEEIIAQEIADRTTIRLITFAVRGGQDPDPVEFAKSFTWNGAAFVAADGTSLAGAIGDEVAEPEGFTDFEPALQDAADFFNDLNGGSGPEPEDVNRIFFLTDGQDNSGPGDNFDPARVPDIYADGGLIDEQGLEIKVFAIQSFGGVQSGFDPEQLNLLDDGLPAQAGEALHVGDPDLSDVEADVAVIGFDSLEASLSEGLLTTLPEPGGADRIEGSGGADVIFGDVPDTDALAVAEGIALPPGSGWFVFAELEDGPGWDRDDTIAYLRDPANQAELIGPGRGQGDTIDAGAGDDIILAQGGDDVATGGAGADLFVYSLAAAEGRDEILDFSVDEGDRLSFTGVTDSDGSGAIDIEDVIAGFADGGGPGGVDTLTLESGSVILVSDMTGALTDLASLESQSLINGA